MHITPEKLIQQLKLEPLPQEGGLFRRTYESQQETENTPMGTAIYFMLFGQGYSHLHRLPTDEIYHFYLGDPVELLELLPDGSSRVTILGQDICNGASVQHVVKGGTWQGSRLKSGGTYALMGTTMAPGFCQEQYEHAQYIQALQQQYPSQKEMIACLSGETKFH